MGVMVSPAHAGIDLPLGEVRIYHMRFPRPRGDRPYVPYQRIPLFAFPPPTRG